jgi:hypothetical protein
MTGPKKTSADVLHFVAAIDKRQQIVSYICETQPLATLRIYGQVRTTPARSAKRRIRSRLAVSCLSGSFRSPPAVVVLGSMTPKIFAFAETTG